MIVRLRLEALGLFCRVVKFSIVMQDYRMRKAYSVNSPAQQKKV
jgi:hypothetical protein